MRWFLLVLVACTRESTKPTPVAVALSTMTVPSDAGVSRCKTIDALTICGGTYEAPSHGGEELVRNAWYTIENPTDAPVDVEIVELAVVDPNGARLVLGIDSVEWSGKTGTTRASIPAGQRVKLWMFGKGTIAKLRYHVVYHHTTRFRVRGLEDSVDASEMYFRHPHTL